MLQPEDQARTSCTATRRAPGTTRPPSNVTNCKTSPATVPATSMGAGLRTRAYFSRVGQHQQHAVRKPLNLRPEKENTLKMRRTRRQGAPRYASCRLVRLRRVLRISFSTSRCALIKSRLRELPAER